VFRSRQSNLLLGSADVLPSYDCVVISERIVREGSNLNIMLTSSMKAPRLMRSLRLAAFIAALAGIVLLGTGATWWHVDSPGSVDACPICCHVAHISALPGATAAALAAPMHVAWVLNAERLLLRGTPSFVTPPSRAPPAC